MDNDKLLVFLLLVSLYGLILIPIIAYIGYHLIIFLIEKWSKKETLYQLPYLKNESYDISEDRLINIIELAYLFNKDTARIISFAIQSKLIFPLYKHSIITVDEKKYFKCYDMSFEKNLFNCYDNYLNNIFFLKSNIINIKYAFEDTLLSDDFYVSQEKITTENNILEVVRTSIKKSLVINPQITTFKELSDKMTFFFIQIVRCSILKLYGYFFLEKPNILYNQEKINNYYHELIKPKRKITLLEVIMSRSPDMFEEYVYQYEHLEKNEIDELYFWGSYIMPYKRLGIILDRFFPNPTPKEVLKKLKTNKFEMRAIRGKEDFLENFLNKDAKLFDVIPMLYKDFYTDNSL